METDPRDEARLNTVLDGKWTLERLLGAGGMGAVYAARHRNGARGAVKVLHPELSRRTDVRERFLREGYAANRVEHRGAVQVLDDDIIADGPDEGTAYLVMEMLEGESLEERVERGPPLTEIELLGILDALLEVLEAAHTNGVVHRDLKPANLFLNADPSGHRVKVLDFGLARLEELRSVTGVGLALGTPSFMAPEQANGKTTEIDARTDLFAVGATAFSILAGRGVHEADGVLELVARMGTLPAPKLRTIAPHVSERTAVIVDQALEFKREDRYPSAAAMRADVQAALAAAAVAPSDVHTHATVIVASPGQTSAASPNESADESVVERAEESVVEREAPAKAPRGPRGRALFVVALLAGAAAVVAFVVLPRMREQPNVPSALGEIVSSLSAPVVASAPGAASAPVIASAPVSANAGDLEAEAGALQDAGEDAAADAAADDEDDDDDDDVDASDVAAIVAHDAGSAPTGPIAAVAHPKRPHASPGLVRHGRPHKRKHRRPKH